MTRLQGVDGGSLQTQGSRAGEGQWLKAGPSGKGARGTDGAAAARRGEDGGDGGRTPAPAASPEGGAARGVAELASQLMLKPGLTAETAGGARRRQGPAGSPAALTPPAVSQSRAASPHGTALSTQGGGQQTPFPSPRGAQPPGAEPRLQAPLLAGHWAPAAEAVRPWRPLTSLGKPGRNQGPLGAQARAGCGRGVGAEAPAL